MMLAHVTAWLSALGDDHPMAPTTLIALVWGGLVLTVFFGLLWTVRGRVK
jgi:hypothetical protein